MRLPLLVAWALAAADEPPRSAEPPRLRRASAIFGDPVMVGRFGRTLERYFTVLDRGGGRVWLLSRHDTSPKRPREVLLRTFGRPDDLTLGRPGRVLVKSPDLAQNPGAFLDGDGGLVLFGGEDDAANPDGPSANSRRGVGVVATTFAEPESFANGTEPTLVLRGSHAGCVEAREHWGGVCQFDGKLTPFRWRDRILLYARANTALKGGGRALQVAAAPAPEGPFGAFEPVTFEGYAGVGFRDANVYFVSVAPNPVDPGSVLGLFPVNAAAGRFDPPARRNVSCLALALSCDGAHFSKLDCFLKSPAEAEGRTADHPATGFVVSDGSVHLYAHRNVPGISESPRSRLERYSAAVADVEAYTTAAKARLRAAGLCPGDRRRLAKFSPAFGESNLRTNTVVDFDPTLSDDRPEPSFVSTAPCVREEASRDGKKRHAVAFLFAGHVRTLRHTADSIVAHALETFGGDAFTFVVASDEDPGSSHGFLGPGDADAARAALARLRPRRAFFGTLGNDTRPALRAGCELPGDDQVKTSARSANAGGSRAEALFQTWARVGRCFALMSDYEVKHDAALVPRYGRRDHAAGFQFRYVVRLRLDATFFEPLRFTACDLDAAGDEGRTGPSAAHAKAFFPLGVAGCTQPCVNDHLAWIPRQAADAALLSVLRDFDDCDGSLDASLAQPSPFLALGDFGTYLRASLGARGVAPGRPLFVPYTIERPCGAGSCAECDRWSTAPHHAKIWRHWLPKHKDDFDRIFAECAANHTSCGPTPEQSAC